MKFASASFVSRILRRSVLLAILPLATIPALSQAVPGGNGPMPSRIDLSAAYGYIQPFDSGINQIPFVWLLGGGVFSASYYFKPHLGIQVEGNYFPTPSNNNECIYTGQAGPIYRRSYGRLIPFVHVLGGAAQVGGPAKQTCGTWGYGVTGGGGLDYVLPIFHNHVAVRLFQADMTYSHVNDPAPVVPTNQLGGVADLYAVRLSAGLNFRFGSVGLSLKTSPSLSCSADPGNPIAGDPVTITSTIADLRSDKDTEYLWDVTAGKLKPNGPGATIDTTGLAPGNYTVSGHLVRGARHNEIASCTTSFTIRVMQPPTVACVANRAAINSGDPVTITATAASPQNRPLTYTYTASEGIITGNGATATLATNGSTPGTIVITCKVADDQGLSAAANASVVIATPAPPETPKVASAQALCAVSFDRDRKRPVRVDNEAKACLDDIYLTMNRSTGAKLVIIGNHAPGEPNQSAAERAMNEAQYLTDEKGIDPTRLDLRIGSEGTRSITNMLLPPGAVLDIGTTTSFDTSSVHRTGQPYGKPGAATTPTGKRRKKRTPPPATPPPA
jgi:hypothetical protein